MDFVSLAYKFGVIKEMLEHGAVAAAMKRCADFEDEMWQAAQHSVQADLPSAAMCKCGAVGYESHKRCVLPIRQAAND
ncbi:MAG: hypothetical protein WC714_28720 [Candidatus Obscuribacterales bacterium]|jgi:hypothetical protein